MLIEQRPSSWRTSRNRPSTTSKLSFLPVSAAKEATRIKAPSTADISANPRGEKVDDLFREIHTHQLRLLVQMASRISTSGGCRSVTSPHSKRDTAGVPNPESTRGRSQVSTICLWDSWSALKYGKILLESSLRQGMDIVDQQHPVCDISSGNGPTDCSECINNSLVNFSEERYATRAPFL